MGKQLQTRGVHVYSKDPKSNLWVLTSIHPIQWLSRQGEGRFAIQDGNIFTAGGELVPAKAVPVWLKNDIATLDPAVRASVGLKAEA